MAADHTPERFMANLSASMRHTQDEPYSNDPDTHGSTQAQPKTWLLCPYFYLDHHEYGHCLGLNLFRHSDLEQHLAGSHVFHCRRCKEPFGSAFLQDQHMENNPSCVLKETYPSKDSVEKTLKRNLKDHRKGDGPAKKLANLCQHLFNWTWPFVMQFTFPPILLLVYYAVTAVVFSLLWASFVSLNNELCIGLSPGFIYEVLMACTSVDLRSVEVLIQLAMKLANKQSSEEGLEVSLEGMLQKLFRISGTNMEDAIAHGTIPNHFAGLGAGFAGQVHGVLCNNPQQLYSIISYLQAIVVVQSNNDIPDQAYNPQADPHASMSSQVPPFISLGTSSGEFPPEFQDITHNNNNGDNFDNYFDYEGEYSGCNEGLSSLGDFPLLEQE